MSYVTAKCASSSTCGNIVLAACFWAVYIFFYWPCAGSSWVSK